MLAFIVYSWKGRSSFVGFNDFLFLLVVVGPMLGSSQIVIKGYKADGSYVADVPVGSFNSSATYYLIGDVSDFTQQNMLRNDSVNSKGILKSLFIHWNPAYAYAGGQQWASTILKEFVKFVAEKEDSTTPIVGKLNNVDWPLVATAPMCTIGAECPSVVMIGTTQLAYRVAKGDVHPLTSYLSSYSFSKGVTLTDDFLKAAFYDYYQNQRWYAMPFVSDFRQLYFNRTTFDALGLMYPPPWGNWSKPYRESWNLEKFNEYVTTISNSIGGGFDIFPCWDEELKLTMLIAQNWGVTLVDANYNCGLNNTNFYEAMNSTFFRYFRTFPIINLPKWINLQSPALLNWKKDPIRSPLSFDGSKIEGQCEINKFLGMQINSPALAQEMDLWHPTKFPNGTIGIGLVPGMRTFLGGSGLIIPSRTPLKGLSWEFILRLINAEEGSCLNQIAEFGSRSLPPYESAWEIEPWASSPLWFTAKIQIRQATPPQYPLSTFPQFGILEQLKPFRMLLLDFAFSNISLEASVDRACQLINYIFLPECDEDDWEIQVSECYPKERERIVSNKWLDGVINVTCKLTTTTLPPPIKISCSYLPFESSSGITLMILSSLGIFLSLIQGILIYIKRDNPINKKWMFSILILFGTTLSYSSIFFIVGPPGISCYIQIWLIALGFNFTFGTFCVHMYRIYKISLIKSTNGINYTKSVKMRDAFYIKIVFFMGFITACLLALWTFLPPVPGPITVVRVVIGMGDVVEPTCSPGSAISITIVGFYFLLYFLLGIFTSVASREVHTPFKERKFLVVSLFTISISIIVLVIIVLTLTEVVAKILVEAYLIVFATACGMFSHTVPKLLHSFQLISISEASNNNNQHTSAAGRISQSTN